MEVQGMNRRAAVVTACCYPISGKVYRISHGVELEA